MLRFWLVIFQGTGISLSHSFNSNRLFIGIVDKNSLICFGIESGEVDSFPATRITTEEQAKKNNNNNETDVVNGRDKGEEQGNFVVEY